MAQTASLIGAEDQSSSSSLATLEFTDARAASIYPPPANAPSGALSNNWLTTLATGHNGPHAVLLRDAKLWVACALNTSLDMLNLVTGTATTIAVPDTGDYTGGIIDILKSAKTGLYYLLYKHGSKVVVATLDAKDRSTTTALVLDAAHVSGINPSFAADDDYLYVCASSQLFRYNLLTGAFSSLLTLLYGGKTLGSPAHSCRRDGRSLYITSADSAVVANGRLSIVRVDLDTWAVVDGGTVASDSDSILTDDFAITEGQIWCGSEVSGKLTIFDKANLTRSQLLDPGTGQSCYAVFFDGARILAGFNTNPGTLKIIDLATHAITTCTFSGSGQSAGPNEICSDGTTYYFTFYGSPGVVSSTTPAASSGGGSITGCIPVMAKAGYYFKAVAQAGSPTLTVGWQWYGSLFGTDSSASFVTFGTVYGPLPSLTYVALSYLLPAGAAVEFFCDTNNPPTTLVARVANGV